MILRNETEHRAALAEIEPFFDLRDDGLSDEQSARVIELGVAIEAYEAARYSLGKPVPAARNFVSAAVAAEIGRVPLGFRAE
jgi:antitoxin component HigA of HigAB toxin-antitoxin module